MSIVPKDRPQQTRGETLVVLAAHSIDVTNSVALLGVRGYYANSMGVKGENDQAMYDDAFFIVSPNIHLACNFNTDPQKAGAKKAKLDAGIYTFHKGLHHPNTPKAYRCLRPFPEGVSWPCTRDGVKSMCGDVQIHRGGFGHTDSDGCQTIYPSQYEAAMSTIYSEMAKYGQNTIAYLLIEN